jgi:hypothetical protein
VLARAEADFEFERARAAKSMILALARRVGSRDAVEQAAILGALDPSFLADAVQAEKIAQVIAMRLNVLAPETERGWNGSAKDGALHFERKLRGDFTLNNRSNMNSAVLIGRTTIRELGWIDPSRTNLADKKIMR